MKEKQHITDRVASEGPAMNPVLNSLSCFKAGEPYYRAGLFGFTSAFIGFV